MLEIVNHKSYYNSKHYYYTSKSLTSTSSYVSNGSILSNVEFTKILTPTRHANAPNKKIENNERNKKTDQLLLKLHSALQLTSALSTLLAGHCPNVSLIRTTQVLATW